MRYFHALSIITLVLSVPASAIPPVDCSLHNVFAKQLDNLVHDDSFEEEFGSLIHKARVYGKGPDLRGEMSKIGKKLGLTEKDMDQLRKTVGAFFCPRDGVFERVVATAFLMGSNQEIITAGHAVTDSWGMTRDLTKCYFENFEFPPHREYLMAQHPRNIVPTQKPDANGRRDDRARLVLANPIQNAIPLMPDLEGAPLKEGEPIIQVAAQHSDFKSSGKDPLLSPGKVESLVNPGDGIVRFKTAEASDTSASGALYLARRNGKWVAKGMIVAMKAPLKDGTLPNHAPYDAASNHNLGLEFSGDFLAWFSK